MTIGDGELPGSASWNGDIGTFHRDARPLCDSEQAGEMNH